ncbi:sortase [Anaerotruncus massiliensis (ex Liu et al. 2021)]|uniref:Sortase n=2 Tax=Anaerotruncus TaxID=244127 RepID=A0A498CXW3_9FIRM|nr:MULTISPECIES: sortase [Anaerotruncus]MBC3939103.1 sortase [Anaerotruncus massiliensis (ex Togo et al. 2019)]RLL10267.1 sortase [Anaerotruncus massiliensis (ex Liu et al. 2021)]
MNLLKKFLRGVYYFCVGVKSAVCDFLDWYTNNRSIPRVLRSRASLAVIVLAVAAGGWGLVSAVSGMDLTRREPVPPSSSAQEEQASQPQQPASEAEPVSAPAEPAESSQPEVDALAGATRYEPVTAVQLSRLLKSRAETYEKEEGATFTPPAAGDIAGWKAVNPDVFGWITIANTNISYPLVYNANTNFYTSRGYYKEASRNGVIWADGDTKFDANGEITSRNCVLYGHNWTNCWRPVRIGNPGDVMFAQLAAYDNAEFAKANPYIRVATLGGDHLYQVFTVFYTDLSFGYNYADGAVVNQIISTAKAKSIHDFGVTVGPNDKIITLSTCTRVLGAGDNQRFVVMAKKIS